MEMIWNFKKSKKSPQVDEGIILVPVAQSISNPGVSNRYSNINSYNQAIEKPASIRDMFAKNNRYAEYPRYSNYPPDNRRMSSAGAYFGGQYNSPQHAPYGYNYVARKIEFYFQIQHIRRLFKEVFIHLSQ